MRKFILILFFLIYTASSAYAGILTMNHNLYEKAGYSGTAQNADEIPIVDSTDKLIKKRQEEARKLIVEGKKLIKKGEKKKDQNLITKGQIKKGIGEKQLQSLKEQTENKKKQEQDDAWQQQ